MYKSMKFRLVKGGKIVASTALVAGGFAGTAFAQTASGGDYGNILSGLDTTAAITAIIAAGALLAGVGFAKWATKKVARFFG